MVGNFGLHEGEEEFHNLQVRRIASPRTKLYWIPSDDVSANSPYATCMRDELYRRYYVHDNNSNGTNVTTQVPSPRPQLLWICNHMGIPRPVSRLIMEYIGSLRPSPTFLLQPNDLLVSVHNEYYGNSSDMNLICRPRRLVE